MTELSFLIDLLLNHKLPKTTRDAVAERIKAVEAMGAKGYEIPAHARAVRDNLVGGVPQAPSTIAAMARHGIFPVAQTAEELPPEPPPVAVIAQTPAAAAALASRQQAINESLSGKVDKQTGRPRKF